MNLDEAIQIARECPAMFASTSWPTRGRCSFWSCCWCRVAEGDCGMDERRAIEALLRR